MSLLQSFEKQLQVMQMRGINGKPYITCDQYIDIDKFKALESKIILGIAKAGPVKCHFSDDILDDADKARTIKQTIRKYVIALRQQGMLDDNDIEELQQLGDWRKQQWWLHLRLPLRNPSWSVVLRNSVNYAEKNDEEACITHDDIKYFPELESYIYNDLPFQSVGRIVIFLQDQDSATVTHRDIVMGQDPKELHRNEFLYLQCRQDKQFFIIDEVTKEKYYTQGHSIFFNEIDYHGADPVQRMTWSVRVDGVFTPEFRKLITGSEDSMY